MVYKMKEETKQDLKEFVWILATIAISSAFVLKMNKVLNGCTLPDCTSTKKEQKAIYKDLQKLRSDSVRGKIFKDGLIKTK